MHHSRSSLAFLSVSHHGVLGVESLEASCVSAGDGGHAVVTVLPKQVIPPLLSILHWGFPAAWDGTSGVADDVVVKIVKPLVNELPEIRRSYAGVVST